MNKYDNIMVSVLMLSYNHERTIARAIEGVISQKTGYKYELIIGDDHSPDNSATIIREYAEKHSDKIVAICREKNIGAMKNLRDLMSRSRGKYIAVCEGDDYWIDNLKLEKQISFLEQNTDYCACYTKCKMTVDGKEASYPFANSDSVSVDDMLNNGEVKRYATCTLVYRNLYRNQPQLLDYFLEGKIGDIIIQTLAVKNGKIKYLEDVTAVYEKNTLSGSSFSASKLEEQVLAIRKAINVCKEISGQKYDIFWNIYMAGFDAEVYWEKKKTGALNAIRWLLHIASLERIATIRRLIICYIEAKKKEIS